MNMQIVDEITHSMPSYSSGVFTEVDDLLYVDLDVLTNRNYQSEGVNEYLYLISTVGKNKKLIFLIRDGINPWLTGMQSIIEQTIKILNLDSNSCFIYGYQNLHIANSTFILVDAIKVWIHQIYPFIDQLPLSNNQFEKHFAGLFGRHDMFRLKLFRHLVTHHKDSSILSYNSHYASWNQRFANFFADDKQWFNNNCPYLLDYKEPRGWVPFQDSLKDIGKHYQTYFIEAIVETDPHTDTFLTEKTTKNLYLGKPFLLLAGCGSLANLHKLGFRTFAPYINESYDSMYGIAERLDCILKEIDRLAALPIKDLQRIHLNLVPVFEHNRKIFESIAQVPVLPVIG